MCRRVKKNCSSKKNDVGTHKKCLINACIISSQIFVSFCNFLLIIIHIGALSRENLLSAFGNYNSKDQSEQPDCLINALFVHCLDSIMPLDSKI